MRYIILGWSVIGLLVLLVYGWKYKRLPIVLPALVWFVLSTIFYSIIVVTMQRGETNAQLYNDLSNALRLYGSLALFAYALLARDD